MSEIIVGKKPFANYQGYAIIQIRDGSKKLIIKGYGKQISRAMLLYDWIKRHFPQYQKQDIDEDRSKTGYIGIKITLEAKKDDSEETEA